MKLPATNRREYIKFLIILFSSIKRHILSEEFLEKYLAKTV